MKPRENTIEQDSQLELDSGRGWLITDAVQCPGLTRGAREIQGLVEDVRKRLAVFSYKEHMPCLWVVFLGGTGTGKSTIFNAFCRKRLSDTGVERPKTSGPIVYAHQDCPIANGFPFPSMQMEHQAFEDSGCRPAIGTPGCLLVLQHNRQDWSHIVVVDTPDLDSVEAENRQIAEDFYLLSDAIVFVTSQEKYADDVPYQFLIRVIQGEKPLFLLINKVNERLTREEVLGALEGQGGQTGSFDTARMWFIPYAPSQPFQWISQDPAFSDFLHGFSHEFPIEKIKDFRAAQQTTRAGDLKIRFRRLLDLLEEENGEAQRWLTHLTALYEKISQDLVKEEERRFTAESRQHLQTEIRRLFTRYDVLAKPRRFIRELILTPFRLLGLLKERTHDAHKDALQRVRQKIDLTPVQGAIERFNRLVLEELSPSDEHSPLFRKLRQADVALKDEEIKARIWEEHDRLDAWLEETFQKLSKGLPRHKKWGIYSTSILWGILILSFEIVVGGGFTVLDAALDSVLAPFVTKGAVELFAYREIQKIAGKLAKRYQEGLLSVLRHQRERYEQCVQSLMTSPETLESLQRLHWKIGN